VEGGVVWRAGVMERSCAVARGIGISALLSSVALCIVVSQQFCMLHEHRINAVGLCYTGRLLCRSYFVLLCLWR
jgi:hypothetical protein